MIFKKKWQTSAPKVGQPFGMENQVICRVEVALRQTMQKGSFTYSKNDIERFIGLPLSRYYPKLFKSSKATN